MNKELKEKMLNIANKEVEAYKDDVLTDFNIIDNNKNVKKWMWIIGKCGTHIIDFFEIQFKETEGYIIFNHCINNNYKKYYIIDMDNNNLIELKKDKINNIYNSVKNIDYDNAIKLINEFYNKHKKKLSLNDLLYNIKRLCNQYKIDNYYKLLCDIGIIDKNNINSDTFKILDMIEAV